MWIKFCQSKINSRWVGGPMGQMNRRPSIWCSKYYFFHDFLQNSLQKYFQYICLFFLKNTKIKVKSFECPKSIKSLKKIMLGTSDAWSTIRLSNRPSDPAWIYLRLTDFWSGMRRLGICTMYSYCNLLYLGRPTHLTLHLIHKIMVNSCRHL